MLVTCAWERPMKPRSCTLRVLGIGGLLLVPLGVQAGTTDCENVPPEGDADTFYQIVETAVEPDQLAEMLAGIGEIGLLADGTGRDSYDLPSGVSVPAVQGSFQVRLVQRDGRVIQGKSLQMP